MPVREMAENQPRLDCEVRGSEGEPVRDTITEQSPRLECVAVGQTEK